MWIALFCVITQRVVVIYYRLFGTNYRSHIQGSKMGATGCRETSVRILYFFDCASRYNSLLMTNLTHFFMSLFITLLYMFRASQSSSSGDRIVLILPLWEWLFSMPVRTGIPSSHSQRLIIPNDVLIQFDLLMMSTVMLETCRDV